MKKVIIFIFVVVVGVLLAENISLESPVMNFKLSINSSKSNSNSVADEIGKRVELLENNYCSKLGRLDKMKAKKTIDEIFELISLIPSDIQVTSNVTSEQVSQKVKSDVNIDVKIQDSSYKIEQKQLAENLTINEESHFAMNTNDFQKLYQNVQDESFSDDKLSIIRIAVRKNYFNIDQLVNLLDLFSFADDKISCVRIVYPKIVDKDNAHNLLNAFTYSDDKKKVEKIINN